MTSFLPQYYELLKRAVMTASGLSNITPHDCRLIASEILRITKHSISETTLKRIFGFAYSKFKPSLFTIDVMSRYCGYEGWEDFCKAQEHKLTRPAGKITNWANLKLNAAKITNFTLQVLRNKSGIPFNQTISRLSVSDHLNQFKTENKIATVLAAPAGHGKTIALCHWIEDTFIKGNTDDNDDIVLFFSTNALMNAFLSGQDLNHWLLALLGYSSEDNLASVLDQQQQKGNNFYLIIDAFDEHVYKHEQFKLLLSQLLDILALYRHTSWFKLILTMRSATWINNRHEFENNAADWFIRFAGDSNMAINVPLFDVKEVKQLTQNITSTQNYQVSADVAAQFSHPLYFQFYYKQNNGKLVLDNISQVCLYELVSTFILNKIYMGQHSAERLLLVKGLVESMDIPAGKYEIERTRANHLVKQYQQAYQDLLSIGFLREVNNSVDLYYNTFIQFTNSYFLSYSIAKTLLYNNNSVIDKQLISQVNQLLTTNHNKLPALKWIILTAFKAGQHNALELLTKAQLNLSEKADLINFIGELLSKQCNMAGQPELLPQYFKQDCSPELFNYFFGLEFINIKYKKTLYGLLKFNLSNRKRAPIYTALAMTAILSLDMADLEDSLNKLKSLPVESYDRFAINPYKCLDAIYTFFKTGEVKKDVAVELTKFCFNPPTEGNYFDDSASNDMMFLLGAYTLLLFHKPLKNLRYIKVLERYYKQPPLSAQHGYSFFMAVVKADSYFKTNKTDLLAELDKQFTILYKGSPETFTDYMKTVYYSLKIKTNISLKKYKYLVEDMRLFMQTAGEHNLSKILLMNIVTSTPDIGQLYPQFYKQCEYDYARLIRENGLVKDAFILNPEQMQR